MDRGRAAAALLALAACIVCSNAAPTASDQTALEVPEGPSNGCYYNFQHYGEGDRIMTNEPCLNCTCHNRMLMCYLRVCPFTKPIGQDCTIEKRADQCCPIVTCPDVPVDLLTSTSTSSPAEYGTTGLGKLDKYGCSINGKYLPEGAKVPPSPNKPCEHCYCIRNMTTCVMQECTLHVDGCTPIYHKDVCCPVRYSCDHPEDEIPLLDDMTTTVRPTPGFLLTTTMSPVTQPSQDCVHDDQIFADGAHIKTENACEHCYCMKGDLVCVVQACGTPMENEGKNCTSLPPRQGQCCPDTYICEGDELSTELSTEPQELTTVPPRRVGIEGSGYRNEPDELYTEIPQFEISSEGSGEEYLPTSPIVESTLFEKVTPEITETSTTLNIISEFSTESHKVQETITDVSAVEDAEKFMDVITTEASVVSDKIDILATVADSSSVMDDKEQYELTTAVNVSPVEDSFTQKTPHMDKGDVTTEVEKTTKEDDILDEVTLKEDNLVPTKEYQITTQTVEEMKPMLPQDSSTSPSLDTSQSVESITPEIEVQTSTYDISSDLYTSTPKEWLDTIDTTSINPIENEIHESDSPILSPGRIPGEGDCLLNSITYENNSIVPSTNNCHTSCRCVSSIIKCDPIICSAPPEYMNDCQPIYDSPESCCPTYVCSTKETVPPKPHNQMSETDSTKPVLASECNSPDCLQLESKPDLSDCINGECTNKDKISSPDTQQVPCEGNECKLDLPHDKQPEIQGEATCTEENGCIKPIEGHTQGECNDDNCKTEPGIECSGSDCVHANEVTTPSLSGSTYHETPTDELTVIPVTNKDEIKDDSINNELPTEPIHVDKEPNTSTETSEIYVTIPIKSSTDISEIETSETEKAQSPEMGDNEDIPKLTGEHIIPTEISDIHITDSPLIETQTNTVEHYHPEHETTESDYSNEVVQHTISDNKYSTVGDDDVQKTTTAPDQITLKISEQPVTETYEIKSETPMTSIQEEVQHALSPETDSHVDTTTVGTDNSHELINRIENVDSITDHIDKELGITENIITETATSQYHTVHEFEDVATTKPNIDSVPEDVVTDKVIENIATHTLSTNTYDVTSESVTEHQINIKLDENYTQSPMQTISEIEVTEAIDTSYEHEPVSGEYKPVSESTYAPNTNEQEVNENRITNVPEINTELPLTQQTNLDEQHVYVTDKIEVNPKEKVEPEIVKEPVEVSLDEDKNTYLQTTESVNAEAKPTEETKTTDVQHTSVDGENEEFSSDKMSTIQSINTDVYATTESIESEEKLYNISPVSTTIRDSDIDNSVQDLHETEKKTTTYPVYDSKVDSTISSNELTNSAFSPNTEMESMLDLTTEMPEMGVEEINTEKSHEELPHTQVIDSFEQHDAYTTEKGYSKESPESIMTTIIPTYTENKTPLIEDETSYIGEDKLASDKQDSSSAITQKVPTASVEVTTSGETTAYAASETKKPESESPFTTVNVKDVYPTEHETVTQITTKIPNLESITTHKYEEIDTTVSIINDRGDDGLSIGTKPDMEVNTEKIELSTKLEGMNIFQETSTDNKILVEVNIPHELSTEEPISEIKVETSEIPEFNTMIPEKVDITTPVATEIDMQTKSPEITSTKYSIPAVTTLEPGESEFINIPTFEVEEHKPQNAEYQTTPQTSDLNSEITTAKEVITSIDILEHTVPSTYEEEKTTIKPVDIDISNTNDFKLDTTNLPKTTESSPDLNLQNVTPLEEIQDKKEITPEFVVTTPRDSTISEIESSTVMKLPDAIAHEEDKIDTPSVDEYGLQTSRPDMSQSEPTTEKDLQQSVHGETTVEQDIQQNELSQEISTLTPLHEETIVTSIPYENLSSPDISLSLVTDKFEIEHETPLPVSLPSTQSSKQEVSIMTTESSESHIDQGSSSTETSPISVPEISSTIISEPIDMNQPDIKTTSSDENVYRTESSKQPEYITEQPDKITTQQASEVSQSNENNDTLQPSVTEKETILDTETHDSSLQTIHEDDQYNPTTLTIPEKDAEKEIEEQPVTKESISNNEEYERTTPAFLEKEVEKELDTQPATKEPSPSDDNQSTLPTFVDKEIEKVEIVTETFIPDIDLQETTTTLLREKDIENEIENQKVTKQPSIITLYETTTNISPDTITTKEIEDQASTEQSSDTKHHYEITTLTSIDKVTEKEIESPSIKEQHIPVSDVSATTASVLIETETEKEIMTVPLENKDIFESTTLVIAEKEKDIESHLVTEESPNNDLYESTTLHLLEKEKENEISSTTSLLGSSSESSVIPSLEAEATSTYKIPDTGDDTERSTETVIKYSETTPYLIELQEHTHQSIDETSSKMPIEEDSTTEQYISEQPNRGDIPIKDDDNLLPTTYDEDMRLTSPKEEKYSTTPTPLSTDRETSVHYDVTTEIDLAVSKLPSEAPKEEEQNPVISETEKPSSQTSDSEAYTEKHINEDVTRKPEFSAETMAPSEEVTKSTTHSTSPKPSEESTVHTEEFNKPEEKPVETEPLAEVPKPELNEPVSDDLPSPDFPSSGAGGYGQEPDYGDSEDQAFGPGTCRYGGKVYVSAQQIPRDDPCDFCFCFRSDIICLQQSCPPPIHGCHEEPIQGFCCPRYECPVSMATTLNVTTTTTTTTTTLPPHFLPHAYKGAAQRRGCQIKGHTYKVGEVVRASSGPCLHCTCGGDGQMKCDPKACTPEPMLRQMIAAAVSAKRRR